MSASLRPRTREPSWRAVGTVPSTSDPRQDAERLPEVGQRPARGEQADVGLARGDALAVCAMRAIAPVTCGAANEVPVHRANAFGPKVSGSSVKAGDCAPSTYVDRMPSPTVEQSTHQPRLEKVLGRRSDVSEPTETTRRNAAGQVGTVSPKFPAAATISVSVLVSRSCSAMTSSAAARASAGWSDRVWVPSDRLTICAPSRTAWIRAQATSISDPVPAVVSARYTVMSAPGATWATMPLTKVPWPAEKSRRPSSGSTSSGSTFESSSGVAVSSGVRGIAGEPAVGAGSRRRCPCRRPRPSRRRCRRS